MPSDPNNFHLNVILVTRVWYKHTLLFANTHTSVLHLKLVTVTQMLILALSAIHVTSLNSALLDIKRHRWNLSPSCISHKLKGCQCMQPNNTKNKDVYFISAVSTVRQREIVVQRFSNDVKNSLLCYWYVVICYLHFFSKACFSTFPSSYRWLSF